jgi:hypothetical protein
MSHISYENQLEHILKEHIITNEPSSSLNQYKQSSNPNPATFSLNKAIALHATST